MKTDALITITCATCPETLEMFYSHESLTDRTLADDIKHDATISSDWHFRDGLFYCDDCGEEQENTRDDRAAQGIADLEMVPYASAVRDCLNNGEG